MNGTIMISASKQNDERQNSSFPNSKQIVWTIGL